MNIKKIFCSLFVCGLSAQELYPTNFVPALRWGPNIVYGLNVNHDEEKFRNFIRESIDNFTKMFDSPIKWTEELDDNRLIRYDRYVVFDEHLFGGCGDVSPTTMGPSVIQLDVDAPKGCGNYEVTKGILGVLGFRPMENRYDRDTYITIVWQNLQGAYAASLDPSYDYYNSTDATFKGYETASILHASQYSEFALDPLQPIYLPKNNQLAAGLALTDEERKPTEKDIKQFKAIYPK